MSARDTHPAQQSPVHLKIRIHTDSAEFDRIIGGNGAEGFVDPIDVPVRTLSPVSGSAMNALKLTSTPSNEHRIISKNSPSTIRSVASEPTRLESTPNEGSPRIQSKNNTATMPHSTKELPSLNTVTSNPSLTRQNSGPSVGNGLVRTISSELGLSTRSNANVNTFEEGSPSANGNTTSPVLSAGGTTPQWSSAVGRANLGKSGRVIERLMGENDMLKRDLNIERLRAEESKQAVKMAEGRMEALTQEYEGKLHEAAINKTLLRRKERQVDDLKAQIAGEKRKATSAMESERMWKDAMEKSEEEGKRKVEEAQTYAALMEGRNNTMTSHWSDQRAQVQRTIDKQRKEIQVIVEDRKSDDQKITLLQTLCDQHAEIVSSMEREKDRIFAAFEAYKLEQETALADIKQNARLREEEQAAAIQESQRVLGELKWALGVHKNVRDAP